MPYVPGFENDLFISYASLDNDDNAVVEFVQTLEKHLSDNLVNFSSPKEKVKVYFDVKRLQEKTAISWEEDLRTAAASCAILVPLISPNYLSSDMCGNERRWFCSQPHVRRGGINPFAVVGWRAGDGTPLPPELKGAQRHPPGVVWLAALSPEERKASAQSFALKLRDALQRMRASVNAVFLGPAAGGTDLMKAYLRDELEKAGYRVVPEAKYLYEDEDQVRELLRTTLLAVHFSGGGNADAIPVMAWSLDCLPDKKTMFVLVGGLKPSPDEEDFLNENAERQHHILRDKENQQVWAFLESEVRTARFRVDPERERVGVACHEIDLPGAKAVAGLIRDTARVSTNWPRFDAASSTAEKLKAFRQTITESDSLLFYWAMADERSLRERLKPAFVRQYAVMGWYLAPPFDVPGKDNLDGLVMRQERENADVATLSRFLERLGWRPD